jgi:hypothetical protein
MALKLGSFANEPATMTTLMKETREAAINRLIDAITAYKGRGPMVDPGETITIDRLVVCLEALGLVEFKRPPTVKDTTRELLASAARSRGRGIFLLRSGPEGSSVDRGDENWGTLGGA